MTQQIIAVLTAALLLGSAYGCGARAETLDEALVEAYGSNPRLVAGRAELRASDELVEQARAGFRPVISANGTLEAVAGQTNFGDIDRKTAGLALAIRQSLYSGGGTTARLASAEKLVLAQRARLVSLEQDVLLDVVDAYTSTWRDRLVLKLAFANETRLERQLQATKDRFYVGEVARTDLAQAEARVAGARSDVEQARANLSASSARLPGSRWNRAWRAETA